MKVFFYMVPIIVFVIWYVWVARTSRGKMGQTMRAHMYANDWSPFMAGYRRAIRDIERTGMMPCADPTISYMAKVAFSEMYGVDIP
jgi:hypothetical protein